MGMPGELPDGPVIKALSELPMPGAQVPSLVGELGSRKLCGSGGGGGTGGGRGGKGVCLGENILQTYRTSERIPFVPLTLRSECNKGKGLHSLTPLGLAIPGTELINEKLAGKVTFQFSTFQSWKVTQMSRSHFSNSLICFSSCIPLFPLESK